ncbi:MAG: GNAT family N-acetyltransferase [Anaerolineae bacterium]|nr:GNAT family N-acetyltransferase [Anaerolineae bacterium]
MTGLNEAARRFVQDKNTPERLWAELSVHTCLVCEQAGHVLGLGCLAGHELKRVYVDPEQQGRGIGRALVAELESEARARSRDRLRLQSSPAAMPFWASLGYRVVGRERIRVGEAEFVVVGMQKELG